MLFGRNHSKKPITPMTQWSLWSQKCAKALAIIMFLGILLLNPVTTKAVESNEYWVGTWATSPLVPSKIANTGFENTTLRLIVNPHIDGSKARIRLTNVFGTGPVTFNKVTIAQQQDGAAIVPDSGNLVTFNGGQQTITIQPGTEVLSDPVNIAVSTTSNLAVSLYTEQASGPATWHGVSRRTSYISTPGDHTSDAQATEFVTSTEGWFWLSGVEVTAADNVKGSLVAFGDSITDGVRSTPNTNRRYPDYLAARIKNESPNYQLAVLNEGISGNRILEDSLSGGPKGLDRLQRDVLSHEHLKAVILLLGINDIGHGTYDPELIINGMKQMIQQVHAKGAKIYGATILPYGRAGYNTAQGEATRSAVNQWIRTSQAFDGVVEFDEAMRDPNSPQQLLPEYDSGDHLHPSDAGYRRMADTVDLRILTQ